MGKEELNLQELWDKFVVQLGEFKDSKVILKAEERLYGYYQTAESHELEFEEGETALTPKEYAEAEGVDHISWHDNETLIDPTKCMEDDGIIENCVKAEFILDDFMSKLEDYLPYQYDNDTEFYAEDYIEETLSDYYTVPELIEEEGNNATKTLKAEESDADIIWMHREGLKGYTITVTLSDEVYDFIEKFKEENS
tara:strand:- start:106 stop:693 length:588 start_codon:yes stop_codon:yes gene_type:complete